MAQLLTIRFPWLKCGSLPRNQLLQKRRPKDIIVGCIFKARVREKFEVFRYNRRRQASKRVFTRKQNEDWIASPYN